MSWSCVWLVALRGCSSAAPYSVHMSTAKYNTGPPFNKHCVHSYNDETELHAETKIKDKCKDIQASGSDAALALQERMRRLRPTGNTASEHQTTHTHTFS